MTLPVNDRRVGPLTGGPNFPFDFKVSAKTDIKVVLTTAALVENILTLDSDYSVALNADQDNNPGGTVVYVLTVGNNVTILGNVLFSQGQSLPNGGGWFPKNVEDALDRLTMIAQQLGEQVSRSLLLPIASTIGNLFVPSPISGKFLRGRADGLGWENADVGGGLVGLPLVVGQGGTGGTTQSTAQDGLGAGAAGKLVFAAATAAVGLAALNGIGKEPIWAPWTSFRSRVTNGPAAAATELTGTGKVQLDGLDFDKDVAQYAQAKIRMPKAWNLGNLTFVPVWTAPTAGAGNVIWGFGAQRAGDGVTLDLSTFTSVTVTDAYIAQNFNHIGPESGNVAVAGAAQGDLVVVEVKRDAAAGGDTFSQSARLLGVMIYYTTNAGNEA